MVGTAHPTFTLCASADVGVEVLDGHSQTEAPLPGDQYEQTLQRTRASIFRDFLGITCVFFGFHGLAFAILISGGLLLDTDVFMETALGAAIVAWLVSVFLALLQFVVALWNALTMRW